MNESELKNQRDSHQGLSKPNKAELQLTDMAMDSQLAGLC